MTAYKLENTIGKLPRISCDYSPVPTKDKGRNFRFNFAVGRYFQVQACVLWVWQCEIIVTCVAQSLVRPYVEGPWSFCLPPLIIPMDDQPSSAPKKWKKKGGGIIKFVRNLIKQPKSANNSTGQFHPPQVSGSSAFVLTSQKTTQEVQSRRLQVSILTPYCNRWRLCLFRSYRPLPVSTDKTSSIECFSSAGFRHGSRWVAIHLTSERFHQHVSKRMATIVLPIL